MKRIASILLAAVLLLALAACGNAPASTPSLQLDDNGDNTFTVTAENAKTDMVCFGQITLGENEGIQLEADFENSGELIVCFVPGEFEAASFPDEASELTIVGQGTESVTELRRSSAPARTRSRPGAPRITAASPRWIPPRSRPSA